MNAAAQPGAAPLAHVAAQVLGALDPELPVYAVLDGARDSRLLSWVTRTGAPAWCLYAGELPAELAEAAPWLLRLGRGHEYAAEFFNEGWFDAWGIVFASAAPSKQLRRHLRRFLLARTEAGKRLLFRYYDPRVLRAYLPTCNAGELENFFGPIDAFATPSRDPHAFQIFRRDGARLAERSIAYDPPRAAAPKAAPRELTLEEIVLRRQEEARKHQPRRLGATPFSS